MVRSVYVVRHGERADVDPLWINAHPNESQDPSLTELGLKQAAATANFIKSLIAGRSCAIYSSPFLRCLETAAELCKTIEVSPLYVHKGLAEFYSPMYFTSQPRLESRKEVSGIQCLVEEKHNLPLFPEVVDAMAMRYQQAAKGLLDTVDEEVLVIVTHGYGVQFITEFLDSNAFVFEMPYCAVSEAEKTASGWRVVLAASANHLAQ